MFNLEGFIVAQALAFTPYVIYRLLKRKSGSKPVKAAQSPTPLVFPKIPSVIIPTPVPMKPKRIGVTPKLRFTVFSRDNFTCQYCGRKPPEVVLEPDHIVSVADGGKTELSNLITSCFDCNRGKGKRSLSKNIR